MGVRPEPEIDESDLLRCYLSLVEQAALDDPRIPNQREELLRIYP